MAQVIWQDLGDGHWMAESAGSKPSGYVHPLALKALEEIGLPIEGLYSKSINKFIDQPIELAVTVCGHAQEACPVLPCAKQKLHWPFEDPADAVGTDEEIMESFRRVRDQIKSKITEYLNQPVFSEAAQSDCLKLIEMALIEDIGANDLGTGVDCTTDAIVPKNAQARAAFVSRNAGVVCGIEIAKLAIAKWAPGLSLEVEINDGQSVASQQTIAVMAGPAHDILTIERTCLNFMCRLSGISSLTRQYVQQISGTQACVLDTRKTTPGWRQLEKYAVACGGGKNHRMGLYDAIMIKDNHLAFYRSLVEDSDVTIPRSIKLARQWIADHKSTLPDGERTILQLEVDTLEQFEIALKTDCDIILLDNMELDQLRLAVEMRNKNAPKILLEASGGVSLVTIGKIAQTGVERISVGALTHSAINFDIGLDWEIK